MKTKPMLTLDDVKRIAAAAEAEAASHQWNVVIAVCDDGGHPLLLHRMDGVAPSRRDRAGQGARGRARQARDESL